jgi:hypothetical protein
MGKTTGGMTEPNPMKPPEKRGGFTPTVRGDSFESIARH